MEDRIAIDPAVHHGAPVIKGTRVPVARLVGAVAGGDDAAQVAKDFGVTVDDVRAALRYAAALVGREQHHPLPRSA